MTHQRQLIALAVTTAILAGACSGSDAADSTIPATEAPSSSSTIEPAATSETTTTATAATSSTTSTTPTTSASTTSLSTTTSALPLSVEQKVIDAAFAAREGYLYAVFNPDAPDALDPMRATHAPGGASLAQGLANFQEIVDNGWRARPNTDIPDTITAESPVEFIDETTAELTLCIVGAGDLYAPGAAEDGSDLIINNEISASLDRVTMVLINGTWMLQTGRSLTVATGGTTCIPE